MGDILGCLETGHCQLKYAVKMRDSKENMILFYATMVTDEPT